MDLFPKISRRLPARPEPGDVVSILYTGNIYAGYRDPTPLFQAIGLLTAAERRHVAVHFYGLTEKDAQGVRHRGFRCGSFRAGFSPR